MSDFMTAILTALGLVLAIEGALYALFPDGMKRMMAIALSQTSSRIRSIGLVMAIIGLGVVWLIR